MLTVEGFSDGSALLNAGVYLLAWQGAVVYVGKSQMMLGRIYSHRVAWGRKSRLRKTALIPPKGILFDQVLYRRCPLHLVDELEAKLIAQYHPRYNTQLKASIPPELAMLVKHIVPALAAAPRVDRRGL
jgi:excinuclease UvrABC nuclease subunit